MIDDVGKCDVEKLERRIYCQKFLADFINRIFILIFEIDVARIAQKVFDWLEEWKRTGEQLIKIRVTELVDLVLFGFRDVGKIGSVTEDDFTVHNR